MVTGIRFIRSVGDCSSSTGDAEQDSESYLEDSHEYLVESLSNTFTPLVPDEVPGGDESLGEFDIAFNEI